MTFAAIIAVAVFVYQYWTIIKSQEKFLVTQSRYLISEAEKEFDRESGVFKEESLSTSIKNSTTSNCHSRDSAAGSLGEDKKSSHWGSLPGALTIRYHTGVINREMRNTVIRRRRRYVPMRGG